MKFSKNKTGMQDFNCSGPSQLSEPSETQQNRCSVYMPLWTS